jgi:hypothetical protein
MSRGRPVDIRSVPVIACAFADQELAGMFKQFMPDDKTVKPVYIEPDVLSLFRSVKKRSNAIEVMEVRRLLSARTRPSRRAFAC